MASTYLATVADGLLDALLAGLAQVTTGRAAPDTSYVSHGPPAYDCCPFAVVYLDPLDGVTHNALEDPPFDQDCIIVPRATWILEWTRCVPALTDDGWPTPATLDVSAQDLLEDLWCVLTELYDRHKSGALVGSGCGDVSIGNAMIIEPQGGCAGWKVPVTTILNDPGPLGS